MNCQSHYIAAAIRRRSPAAGSCKQCGVGLGAAALAELAGAATQCRAAAGRSARAEAAALRRQGEARHLPVHGRRAEPSGAVRQQAGAGQVRRQAAAAGAAQGLPGRVHQSRTRKLLGPKFKFAKHGQCGAELSELLPHLATVVDDIAIVKSMVTDAFNHAPAQILMNTGSQQFGRPSIGSWIDLRPRQRVAGPARLRRLQHRQEGPQRRQLATGAAAFCRRSIRACRSAAAATRCCISRNPPGIDRQLQRDSLDAIRTLNQHAARRRSAIPRSPPASARFEMAFRMQASAPELMDLSQRAEGDARHVRRRAGQAVVRQQLPARPPAGRARRALRAALPRSLGPARQPRRRPEEELRATPTRPAPPWSRTSSSAACSTTRSSSGAASSAARRWCRAATTAATTTPTPSPCGWPAAA